MAKLRPFTALTGLAGILCLPAYSTADTISLRRDNVLPVVFERDLTLAGSHVGDTFTVRLGDDDRLPRGTELLGHIDRIRPGRGPKPSTMNIRFTSILLPDHSKVALDATAIPLDDRYISHGGDGRIVAKQDYRKQQSDVIGGAIGGFIIGGLFHRRVTGAILGTIIGSVAAQSERNKDNNVIAKAGDKIGALLNRDVRIDSNPGAQILGQMPDIVLKFKDDNVEFPSDAMPYWLQGTLMVPLEPVAGQMGLNVDRRKDRTIVVDGNHESLELTQSSRHATLNSNGFLLPRTVVDHNGVVYVPLEALVPFSRDTFMVNGMRYSKKT